MIERSKEFNVKIAKIRKYLEEKKADGVVLSRVDSIAWVACGADTYVNIAADTGVATVLVLPEKIVVLTTRIESQRLLDEELRELPLEVVALPWQADREQYADKELIKGRTMLADAPFGGLPLLPADFVRLMYDFTENEIERYREIGRLSGGALQGACFHAKPGISEDSLAGLLARNCLDVGVQPVVILIAADNRLLNYRHPLPTGNKIKKNVMLVVCGRRNGLIASCTRIVSAGGPDNDLKRRHEACARVDAVFNTGTRPGRRVGDIFIDAMKTYTETGFDGEWNLHHQGGGAGYRGRYFLGTETCDEIVIPNSAYAWNPSITGTKCEDTLLVLPAGNEFITRAPGWPMVKVNINGSIVERPDILTI